jgi:hypothetical protein
VTTEAQPLTLGRYDEPQHSGAVVATHWGDYRIQEIWVRSGANIGNWYCLGGEFLKPRVWIDRRSEAEKLMWPSWSPQPEPGEVPLHPHWEDVFARGPVTLLVPGDQDAYRDGWRNGRQRMVEQMKTVADDDE